MEDERVFLTPEQAISLIGDSEWIHTFRQAGFGGPLIGSDWSREEMVKLIDSAIFIEVGGVNSKKMGHGLVITANGGPIFVEVDTVRLEILESQVTKSTPQP